MIELLAITFIVVSAGFWAWVLVTRPDVAGAFMRTSGQGALLVGRRLVKLLKGTRKTLARKCLGE